MITMEQKHHLELRETAEACRAEGREEGTARTRKLVKALLDAGRIEDMRRMCDDDAYREQLFEEFGLSVHAENDIS